MVALLGVKPRYDHKQMLVLSSKFSPDPLSGINGRKPDPLEVNTIHYQVHLFSRSLFDLDQVIGRMARHGDYRLAQPCAELVAPDMPLLIDPRVIVGIMPSQDSTAGPRHYTSQQSYDRRFKQVSVQNVDVFPVEIIGQSNHPKRILAPPRAIAAKATHTFRFHIVSKPRRHRV
jgi:hypothetical protein